MKQDLTTRKSLYTPDGEFIARATLPEAATLSLRIGGKVLIWGGTPVLG